MNKRLLLLALLGMVAVGLGVYLVMRPSQVQVPVTNAQQSGRPINSNDISDTYGMVGETVFNKKTMTAFETPGQFFRESGKNSFNGLKFDVMKKLPPGLRFVDGKPLTPEDYASVNGR